MNLKKTIFFLIIIFFIIGTFGFIGSQYYVVVHEITHKEVFRLQGASSTIRIGFLEGETEALKEDCDDDCIFATSMVEVVGYHTGIIITNLWLLLIAYSLIKFSMRSV